MKFPYIKFPFKDTTLKWVERPFIPIKILGPKSIWEGYALLDSGADRCLFNAEIADDIGVDLSKCQIQNFGGIEGGNIRAKLQKIKLQVVGIEEKIEVNAGFVNSNAVSAILGQEGFFDNLRIKFEKDHGIIEVNLAK